MRTSIHLSVYCAICDFAQHQSLPLHKGAPGVVQAEKTQCGSPAVPVIAGKCLLQRSTPNDFLLHNFEEKYDYIIGNPPFFKMKSVNKLFSIYRRNAVNNAERITGLTPERALQSNM